MTRKLRFVREGPYAGKLCQIRRAKTRNKRRLPPGGHVSWREHPNGPGAVRHWEGISNDHRDWARSSLHDVPSAAGYGVAASLLDGATRRASTCRKWSPEYVKSIAGTEKFDTAGRLRRGRAERLHRPLSYWYTGPFEADPRSARRQDKAFWEAFKATYPNIDPDVQSHRLQRAARQVPHRAARQCRADGDPPADPRRRRVRRQGLPPAAEARGRRLPTRRLLARRPQVGDLGGHRPTASRPTTRPWRFIWNAKIFADAGLDPENPPATWDDVVAYSKQINDKLGIAGYGLVAKQNAGNTPFRFMPQLWAYGGGALDEASAEPDLQDDRAQQRRHQGRPAGRLRHVRARQVGARPRR